MDFLFKFVMRFGGIMLWGIMIYFFILFTEYESHGHGFRMNAFFLLLYDLVGKWGVMIIMAIMSVIWTRYSYKSYKRMKNGELIDGKNPDGSQNFWAKKKVWSDTEQ